MSSASRLTKPVFEDEPMDEDLDMTRTQEVDDLLDISISSDNGTSEAHRQNVDGSDVPCAPGKRVVGWG